MQTRSARLWLLKPWPNKASVEISADLRVQSSVELYTY